jgi:hypothetical protein
VFKVHLQALPKRQSLTFRMLCTAAGDLQLRLFSDMQTARRSSSLHASSQGDSLANGRRLSPLMGPWQQADSSRRQRMGSEASRFAAEAAAAAQATDSITNVAGQQALDGIADSRGGVAGSAAEWPAGSPFAAAQQQVRRQPSVGMMNSSSSGGGQDSKTWRQLASASMQEEVHESQRRRQVSEREVHRMQSRRPS